MPAVLIDLTNRRFGRLVVHHRAPPEFKKKPRWVCVCDCGNMCMVEGTLLRNGSTTSCGCFQREDIARRRTKHGARSLATRRTTAAGRRGRNRCSIVEERGMSPTTKSR